MKEIRTVSLRTTAYEVRAIFADGKTLFHVTDLCIAGGLENPRKWMDRNIITHDPEIFLRKISAPVKEGMLRTLPMYFVDRKSAERLLTVISCKNEMRKDIQQRILSFAFEEEPECISWTERSVKQAASPLQSIKRQVKNPDALRKNRDDKLGQIERQIDSLVYSLIDLKRTLTL